MIYFVIVTLAIVIIASVFYQVKSLQPKLSKFDKLHVLPNYSFFAPKPITYDYRLIYKIIAGDNTEWQEIPIYKYFNWGRIFWNPFKYYNKGMIDSFNFLVQEFNALKPDDKEFIVISEHYLNTLMLVAHHAKQKDAIIRFAIVTADGGDAINIKDVIFASGHQKL